MFRLKSSTGCEILPKLCADLHVLEKSIVVVVVVKKIFDELLLIVSVNFNDKACELIEYE
ncbi:hypothetical protein T07_14336 [Trichinella nelsoni]|uniref:Uncharacterized protein n=1 Tax=Trichinella nelsoni TaxID=6336 RepID=A0A0V0S548_9BILA|nr:hypothetical protein T07_14336 [Trichinella nelsoni]